MVCWPDKTPRSPSMRFWALLAVILLDCQVTLVTCISCVDKGAVDSSFPTCCLCALDPELYLCPLKCPENTYPVNYTVRTCAKGLGVSTSGSEAANPRLGHDTAHLTSGKDLTTVVHADTKTDEPPTPPPPHPPQTTHPSPVTSTAHDDPVQDGGGSSGGGGGEVAPAVLRTCSPCDRACQGCTGPGPDRCRRCAPGCEEARDAPGSCQCTRGAGLAAVPGLDENNTAVILMTMNAAIFFTVLSLIVVVLIWRRRLTPICRHWMNTEMEKGRKTKMLDATVRSPIKLQYRAVPPCVDSDPEDPATKSAAVHTASTNLFEDIDSVYHKINPLWSSKKEHEKAPTSLNERQTRVANFLEKTHAHNNARPSGLTPDHETPILSDIDICPELYCDCIISSVPLLGSSDETNPKLLSQETSTPLIHSAEAVLEPRHTDATPPPLPPRNKTPAEKTNTGEHAETSQAETPATTGNEASEPPDKDAASPCTKSSAKQPGSHDNSPMKNTTCPNYPTEFETNNDTSDHERETVHLNGMFESDKNETANGPDTTLAAHLNEVRNGCSHTVRHAQGNQDSGTQHPVLSCSNKFHDREEPKSSYGKCLGSTRPSLLSLAEEHDYSQPFSHGLYFSLPERGLHGTGIARSLLKVLLDDVKEEVSRYPCTLLSTKKVGVSDKKDMPVPDWLRCFLFSALRASSMSTRSLTDLSTIACGSQSCARLAIVRRFTEDQAEIYGKLVEAEKRRGLHIFPFFPFPSPDSSHLPSLNAPMTKSGTEEEHVHGTQVMLWQRRYSPSFSVQWQKEQVVSHLGGVVRTEGSAVSLEVPPGAVLRGNGVTVQASVSTHLEQVYSKLDLPAGEHVASPIAEYFAGPSFRFHKPVRIVLPHFLPRRRFPEEVQVYVFHRQPTGHLSLGKLTPRSEDGGTVEDTDVYSFLDDGRLEIFTNHFSGYFCTTCQKERVAQDLNLVLFGRHVQKASGKCLVDLRLELWDNRLEVPDFEQACFQRARSLNDQDMHCVDWKSLAAPEDSLEVQTLGIGCQLELSTEEGGPAWTHATRGRDRLVHPVRIAIPLKTMFPCDCYRPIIPKKVDWKVTSTPETSLPDCFECWVDVGYVLTDQLQLSQPLTFLESPAHVTIDVSLTPVQAQAENGTSTSAVPGGMDRISRPTPPLGLPETMLDPVERGDQWPSSAQVSRRPPTTIRGAGLARTGTSPDDAFPHHSMPGSTAPGRAWGNSEGNSSDYVSISDLVIETRLVRPHSQNTAAGSPAYSLPALGNGGMGGSFGAGNGGGPVIHNADHVNFTVYGSLESSGYGDSSASSCPTSGQRASTASSTLSNDSTDNERPRMRSDPLNSRLDLTPRAARLLGCPSSGSDESEGLHGHLESSQSDGGAPNSSLEQDQSHAERDQTVD